MGGREREGYMKWRQLPEVVVVVNDVICIILEILKNLLL